MLLYYTDSLYYIYYTVRCYKLPENQKHGAVIAWWLRYWPRYLMVCSSSPVTNIANVRLLREALNCLKIMCKHW